MEGKVAIVTGGAKGIGAAACRRFLDEGAKFVAFIDVDEASGISLEQDLQNEHGKDSVKFFKGDVSKDEDLFDVYDYVVKHHAHIDVVLNNAGIANDANHKRQVEINFTALVTSSLKALEIMRKDRGGTGGTIINASSISALALQKTPFLYVYPGTKSAILMFSSNLGTEEYFTHTGVRVITMCIGLTDTDISETMICIDDLSNTATNKLVAQMNSQPATVVGTGIVEAFKYGKSGSTWLVSDSEITDITERVTKAYQVMSGEIQI